MNLEFIALAAVLAAISALEIPSMVRRRLWKELAAFIFLLVLGTILSILGIMGIQLPFFK